MRVFLSYLWCHALGGRAQKDVVPFQEAFASTSATNDKFGARFAIRSGSEYWSTPSDGPEKEVVTFTAIMNTTEMLYGVDVFWDTAPGEVEVLWFDNTKGLNAQVVRPWTRSPVKNPTYQESLLFDPPVSCMGVTLRMRGKRDKRIAIRQIQALTQSILPNLLISGITVDPIEGEQCLQVKNGKYEKGQPVISDSCLFGAAAGDARIEWFVTALGTIQAAASKDPPLCIGAKEYSSTEEVPKDIIISLEPCYLMESSAVGKWQFSSNNQLVSRVPTSAFEGLPESSGGWCLSSSGPSAGHIDVLAVGNTATITSYESHSDHPIGHLTDGNDQTYWASSMKDVPGEHDVSIDVDLGEAAMQIQADKLWIDWEFPALSYQLFGSENGVAYFPVMAQQHSNSSIHTVDELYHIPTVSGFRYYKLKLFKLHPELGFPEEQRTSEMKSFLYGISRLSIYENGLEITLKSCQESANESDARDKWFTQRLKNADGDNNHRNVVEQLETTKMTLEAKLESLEDINTQLMSMADKANKTKVEYDEFTTHAWPFLSSEVRLLSLPTAQGTLPNGYTPSAPAENCHEIRSVAPESPSGWYFTVPACAPRPIHSYCHFGKDKLPHLIHLFNGSPSLPPGHIIGPDTLNSIEDVTHACARIGLEPFNLRDLSDLKIVIQMLKGMQFDLSQRGTRIPLAFDASCSDGYCEGRYREFHDLRDVSHMLKMMMTRVFDPTQGHNIAYYDLKTDEIVVDYLGEFVGGVLCQSTVESGDLMDRIGPSIVDINCHATAFKNLIFSEGMSGDYRLRCPRGCVASEGAVYGSNGIYDQGSSICRAAVHHGVITDAGGIVMVSFESPLIDGYVGSTSNGIESSTMEVHRRSPVAIRVASPSSICPIDTFALQSDRPLISDPASKGSSFLQLGATEDKVPPHSHGDDGPPQVTASMNAQLKKVYDLVMVIHGGQSLLGHEIIKVMVDHEIAQSLKYIKPIRSIVNFVGDGSDVYRDQLDGFISAMNQVVSTSESEIQRLDIASRAMQEALRHPFPFASQNSLLSPFNDYEKAMPEPIATRFIGDLAHWALKENDANTQSGLAIDESDIENQILIAKADLMHPFDQHALFIDHVLFYDIVINVSLDVSGLSSSNQYVGILFRYADESNHYRLDITRQQGDEFLLTLKRTRQRSISDLSRKNTTHDDDKEMTIQIVLKDSLLSVYVHQKILIQIQEASFREGTVGLAALGLTSELSFTEFNVKALPCQQSPPPREDQNTIIAPVTSYPVHSYLSMGQPPLPAHCSVYRMDQKSLYFGIEYPLMQGPQMESLQERSWYHLANYGGKHHVFGQRHVGRSTASVLLFRRPYGVCYEGFIVTNMSLKNLDKGTSGGVVFNCSSKGDCFVAKLDYDNFGLYKFKLARNPSRIVGSFEPITVNAVPKELKRLIEADTEFNATLEIALASTSYSRNIEGSLSYPVLKVNGETTMGISTWVYTDKSDRSLDSRFGLYGKQSNQAIRSPGTIEMDVSFTKLRAEPISTPVHATAYDDAT